MMRWTRLACSLAAAAGAGALTCVAALAAHQQVRDNTPIGAGTATISGRVFVDGPVKQPARRVRVTLTDVSRVISGQTATTDDSGAFAFQNLPAGRFEVQAYKPGYLRASYGASRPERAGTPVVVKEGAAMTNLAITMSRGGVITGLVRDARGGPVPGISVRVLRFGFSALNGERTLSAPSGGSSATSDDRGEYRAYGLPPGSYLVLVNPLPPGRSPGGPGLDDIQPLTSAELQQALRAARAGMPNTAVPPLPPALSTSSVRVNYAPVFHPGVTNVGAATTIALGIGEEHRGADITIQHVPTATISGTITDPSGALPQLVSVTLVPAGSPPELLAGAGLSTSTQSRPDGTFVFGGVAPGAYTVKARTGQAGGGRGVTTAPATPLKWAAADVTMNGQDLHVPLTLQRGVAINGRVEFEGTRPPPEVLQTLTFRLVPPGAGGQLLSSTGGRVDADGRFAFADLVPDAYQFLTQWTTPGTGGTWTIKSSVANGRDAYDAPLIVSPTGAVDWTITYTDTPASLTGVLVDRGGRAATDYYILVFPTDRTHWTPGSRRIRTSRPGTDGAFGVRGVPPGEYFVAALTDLESGEWNDAAFLEPLVKTSATVTLKEGETTRQDLQIGGAPSSAGVAGGL